MADNYLERRMDDYQSGRLSKNNVAKTKKRTKDNVYLLVGEPLPVTAKIITALCEVGKVIWIGDEFASYHKMAQQCGARLYPFGVKGIEKAVRDFEKFDAAIIVDHAGNATEIISAAKQTVIIIIGESGEATFEQAKLLPDAIFFAVKDSDNIKSTAEVCRLLTSRDARHLSGNIFVATKN